MKRRWLCFVLVLVFLPAVRGVMAHDIWLERQGEELVLLYGHRPTSHAGAGRIEYPVKDVKEVACFTTAGERVDPSVVRVYPVRIGCASAVTCVLTSSGYWSKTPFGTKRLPKDEAKSPLNSWLSYEGVKRIDAWSDALALPLTTQLELVPLNDPLALKEGDKLRLQVFLDGRPVQDATVAYDGKPRGISGEDGKINVRVRRTGLQLIQASITMPVASEKADEIVHAATLNFEVK